MSDSTDFSTEARVRRVNEEYGRKRTRFFVGFALVEGAALAAATLVVYVLGIVDPDQGMWLIIVLALLGAISLSVWLVTSTRSQQQAIRDVGGTAPPPRP
ncbi:hypothetical protein J2Y69_002588 [Microbacterium resistens]|uniref:Uncharacterized protein n=1 Tax=Microbacterium resistens TaxID=156977 RepID=A0ABU1SEE5_9MICO|nr:hypothetical protein [Microbacterium resistens]MDR6867980.1 hypothetical protein [Microbacterium resistens]